MLKKMKTRFTIAMTVLTVLSIQGQTNFQKTYGGTGNDFGHSVQQTTDGGYILFGQTSSFGNGQQDMYLVKTDNQGYLLWYKTYGGASWEFGISVQQTTDGGYILCGAYSGLDNDSLALIKTDVNGNEVWNKKYSGSINKDVGQFVRETADGGFIAVGFTGSGYAEDIYLLKTDINGNEQWNKVYNSTGSELGVGVRQTSDGGYAIIGQTDSKGNGGKDLYLIKTNSIGDTIWTKTYGTPSDEIGRSLYITSDGGFILLGFQDSAGGNVYLIKTDLSGNEQWSKYYGGSGWDIGHSVQQTTDDGYILAGRKENTTSGTNDMYCIKTNNSGTIQWENTYPKGIMSDANSVQQTSDGGYILLGTTTDTTGGINADMYLVKINSLGLVSVFDNNYKTINITTYPNPFNEYTTINFENLKNKEFTLKIINIQGLLIRTIDNITTGQVKIERNNLVNGLYFFQLLSESQVIASGKLLIE